MKGLFVLVFVAILGVSTCDDDRQSGSVAPPINKEETQPEQIPEQSGQSGQTPEQPVNLEGMPVMLGTHTKYDVDVEELSGLCFTLDSTALWACGDQGVLKQISLTDFSAKQIWSRDADMEDVTIDPATGNLYLALEYSQKVYRLTPPKYNNHETIFYVQEAIDKGYENSGLEGIAYYKDDMLFVGSQWGANLWIYKFDGTKVSKVSLSKFADEIAGLCYDPVGDWLWVVDSNYVKAYICTVDGKLLATYNLGSVSNAESICVDRKNSCVWIGSDEGSSKLYKYDFKF